MTNDLTAENRAARMRGMVTVFFCVVAALAEGIDLQSAGIAAPGVAMEFNLAREQVGNYVSFSILGLLFGAFLGGRFADKYGRKWVLIWSVAIFGLFSLGTAYAWDYQSMLAIRLLTGLGLGGAMANLVALSSEAAGPRYQGTAVGLVYMGLPLGSTITAFIGAAITPPEWRTVFYVGGIAPLIVVPLLAFALPESADFEKASKVKTGLVEALFGGGRALTTILLWVAFFFVQLAIYLVINWMPTLLRDQGFDQAHASTIQSLFSIGSIIGTVSFGRFLDRFSRVLVAVVAFICAIGAQFSLANVAGLYPVSLAVFGAGVFLVAAQLVLLSTAPRCYGVTIRGTGVGSAVAAGRFGGYVGPTTAGYLMAAGMIGPQVLLMSVPGLIVSALATLIVLSRATVTD